MRKLAGVIAVACACAVGGALAEPKPAAPAPKPKPRPVPAQPRDASKQKPGDAAKPAPDSSTTLAGAAVAQRSGTPMITSAATNPAVTEVGDMIATGSSCRASRCWTTRPSRTPPGWRPPSARRSGGSAQAC